jgi:hypothetical protein
MANSFFLHPLMRASGYRTLYAQNIRRSLCKIVFFGNYSHRFRKGPRGAQQGGVMRGAIA